MVPAIKPLIRFCLTVLEFIVASVFLLLTDKISLIAAVGNLRWFWDEMLAVFLNGCFWRLNGNLIWH